MRASVRFGKLSFYAFDAAARRCDITVMDPIGSGFFGGGVTAADINRILKECEGADTLEITMSSPGGDVFEGIAIYNAIARFGAKTKVCRIDGVAASIASIVALSCERRITAKNARWMIHNAKAALFGGVSADEARNLATRLDETNGLMADTYAERTGQKRSDCLAWMAAETWMTADVAKERGFTTEIMDGSGKTTAHAGHPLYAMFAHTPDDLRTAVPPPAGPAPQENTAMKQFAILLGLAETASEVDILAALTRNIQSARSAGEQFASVLALSGKATAAEASGVFQAWKAGAEQVPALQAKVSELTSANEKRDLDSLVAKALDEKKITPAQEAWARGLGAAGLTAFLAVAVPIVATTERKPPAKVATEVTGAPAGVYKILGVDPNANAAK